VCRVVSGGVRGIVIVHVRVDKGRAQCGALHRG
jgi:hypothetical protein